MSQETNRQENHIFKPAHPQSYNLRGGCQWSKFWGTNDLGSLVAYPRPLSTLMIMVQKICVILGTFFVARVFSLDFFYFSFVNFLKFYCFCPLNLSLDQDCPHFFLSANQDQFILV